MQNLSPIRWLDSFERGSMVSTDPVPSYFRINYVNSFCKFSNRIIWSMGKYKY